MEIGYHEFPSGKRYAYIKADDGSLIFLRNIVFLRNTANPKEVAIVHEWGMENEGRWEPPKGQMEWIELADKGFHKGDTISETELYKYMARGALREMVEESNLIVSEVQGFRRLPMVYAQAWEESGIPGAQFLYQYWTANLKPERMLEAQGRMNELVTNSDWKGILPSDVTEKDKIRWWKPSDGWKYIRGGFSKKMTQLFYK